MALTRKQVIDRAQKKCVQFNNLRKKYHSRVYTMKELVAIFKENKFGFGAEYVNPYIKYGILIHVGKQHNFKFPDEPVYYMNFVHANEALNNARRQKPAKEEKVEAVEIVTAELVTEESFTKECIEYLKKLGYKILKPTTEFVEL